MAYLFELLFSELSIRKLAVDLESYDSFFFVEDIKFDPCPELTSWWNGISCTCLFMFLLIKLWFLLNFEDSVAISKLISSDIDPVLFLNSVLSDTLNVKLIWSLNFSFVFVGELPVPSEILLVFVFFVDLASVNSLCRIFWSYFSKY